MCAFIVLNEAFALFTTSTLLTIYTFEIANANANDKAKLYREAKTLQ